MRATAAIAISCLLLVGMALPAPAAAGRAEHLMVRKINQVRAWHGLHKLGRSRSLMRSSERFARWLMRRDFFGHRSHVSANHRRFRWLGEALSLHWGWRTAIRRTVRRWLRSRPHRRIVLSRRVTWVGAGGVGGRFRGRRATMWVLQTGRRRR